MITAPTDRIILGTWPTPLEPAPRLAAAIGLHEGDLWLKRDDLTGLAAGGNKIRKLEWTLAEAVSGGADTIVTTGAAQSNHARLTAAAGVRLGLAVVLVFPGASEPTPAGNLLLDQLLGATIVWTGDPPSLAAAAEDVAADLRARGRRPAIIPFGGSSGVGAQGYRVAADEILYQATTLDHVVCALGSGGTMAGLVAGLGTQRVLGVHTGAVDDPRAKVAALLHDMGETPEPELLRIRTDQVGDGCETPDATRCTGAPHRRALRRLPHQRWIARAIRPPRPRRPHRAGSAETLERRSSASQRAAGVRPEGQPGGEGAARGGQHDGSIDAGATLTGPVDVLEVYEQRQFVDDQRQGRTIGDSGQRVAPMPLAAGQRDRADAGQARDSEVVVVKVMAAQ